MRSRKLLILIAIVVLAPSLTPALAPFVSRVLRACGPDFPWEILPERKTALVAPPPAMPIVAGLVPTPGDHLPVHEDLYGDPDKIRTAAETLGFPAQAGVAIQAMRALPDGEAAYAAGETLPEA